jgi:hypothetical protein
VLWGGGPPLNILPLELYVRWIHLWFIHHKNAVKDCLSVPLPILEMGGLPQHTKITLIICHYMWNLFCLDVVLPHMFGKDAKHTYWWHSHLPLTQHHVNASNHHAVCLLHTVDANTSPKSQFTHANYCTFMLPYRKLWKLSLWHVNISTTANSQLYQKGIDLCHKLKGLIYYFL